MFSIDLEVSNTSFVWKPNELTFNDLVFAGTTIVNLPAELVKEVALLPFATILAPGTGWLLKVTVPVIVREGTSAKAHRNNARSITSFAFMVGKVLVY
jgi:hypothetical protein